MTNIFKCPFYSCQNSINLNKKYLVFTRKNKILFKRQKILTEVKKLKIKNRKHQRPKSRLSFRLTRYTCHSSLLLNPNFFIDNRRINTAIPHL